MWLFALTRCYKYLIISFGCALVCESLNGQNTQWYLGTGLKVDFSQSEIINTEIIPPLTLYNQFRPQALGSFVVDSSSQLSLYSNGIAVFDKNLNILPNGDTLSGDGGILQSALFVPHPVFATQYYLFTVGNSLRLYDNVAVNSLLPDSLTYSIVDLSLNNGLGDVVTDSKNIFLQTGGYLGLTMIPGLCNFSWILAVDEMGFNIYHITDEGIELYAANLFGDLLPYVNGPNGYMRVSPNGEIVAVIDWVNGRFFRLFKFDKYNGILSDIGMVSHAINFNKGSLGTNSFSFDYGSKFIYAYEGFVNEEIELLLVRYDISSKNIDDIIDSREVITELPRFIKDLQMSPTDTNMIIAHMSTHLGAIYDTDSDTPIYVDSIFSFPENAAIISDFPDVLPRRNESENLLTISDPILDTTICSDEALVFNISEYGLSSFIFDGDTITSIQLSDAGRYEITLSNGCAEMHSSIVVEKRMDCDCHVYIPNGVAPLSLFKNDTFTVKSNCPLNNYSLNIYDRWGSTIFTSLNPEIEWDCMHKGDPVLSGVYTYRLTYIDNLGDEQLQFGTITVVK